MGTLMDYWWLPEDKVVMQSPSKEAFIILSTHFTPKKLFKENNLRCT